jgi:hypothetical protein
MPAILKNENPAAPSVFQPAARMSHYGTKRSIAAPHKNW